MFRLNKLITIILIFISFDIYAKDKVNIVRELNLKCNVVFNNFSNINNASITSNIVLKNLKNSPSGSILVTQTKIYEFWAMAHGIQKINGKRFINNFQVAIKNKKTNNFMHALSDTSYTPKTPPKHARISLVTYFQNSYLEKGELFFECFSY